ncbi:MAG: HEAT repeat domain-containing protein [Actinomycetota bacterium]
MVSRFDIIAAGFTADEDTARAGAVAADGHLRASALRALARMGRLAESDLPPALDDTDPEVRRTAAELAADFPGVDLTGLLSDSDVFVAEMAAWAMGERGSPVDGSVTALVKATLHHGEVLVREAAAAALGAIGDPRGLDAIIAACSDKPTVRRRAVLALAPFDDPRIEPLLRKALDDRDWQVRQNAEDMLNPRG